MAQLVKSAPCKSDNLSSISTTPAKAEGENQLHEVVPWPLHGTHTHTQIMVVVVVMKI